MEIYTCNIDGTNLKQITNLGYNWSPFFIPVIQKNYILFKSRYKIWISSFNLYMIDTNSENLRKFLSIKHLTPFLSFLMMEKKLYFHQIGITVEQRETNIFLRLGRVVTGEII